MSFTLIEREKLWTSWITCMQIIYCNCMHVNNMLQLQACQQHIAIRCMQIIYCNCNHVNTILQLHACTKYWITCIFNGFAICVTIAHLSTMSTPAGSSSASVASSTSTKRSNRDGQKSKKKRPHFECDLCPTASFNSITNYTAHLNGTKHRERSQVNNYLSNKFSNHKMIRWTNS